MESSEEAVTRLKSQLSKLVGEYQKTLAANIQLEKVNEQLSNELTKQNEQGIRLTQQNAILNTEIDHLSSEQSQHFDGHQQLKEKLTATFKVCRDQQEEIARLKRGMENQRHLSIRPNSSISVSAQSDGALNSLRAELKKLETELLDSYEIIDELEFEVEQIAFLEGENERLNEELNAIRRAEDDTDGLPVILSRRVDDRKGNDGASLSGATLTEHLDHCQLLADDEDVAAITTTVDADDQVKSPKQKLVHQRTVSASGNDVIASTSPSTAKESDGGDQQQSNFSRIINGSVRRRGELHKKLESLHKRQSLRSGNLLDRFRQDLPAGDDLSHIRESS